MNNSPKKVIPVSIIVPSLASPVEIIPLLSSLYESTVWPKQIIIVDVRSNILQESNISDSIPRNFLSLLTIIHTDRTLFPGEARNKAFSYIECDLIAFLDLYTLPHYSWLESSYDLIEERDTEVVFGLTKYIAKSHFQQSLIDSTYGRNPVQTLPGSMMTRTFFNRVGHFLPKIRSGEDTDWLIRCNQFFEGSPLYSIPLTYRNVPRTHLQLCLKWFRNYTSCASIHLEYQRFVYIFTVCAVLVFVAYNWNSVMAQWDFTNPLYMPNITKVVFAFFIFLYFAIRGLLMPLMRGVPPRHLLPFRFLRLVVICFVIDCSKALAFLITRLSRFLSFDKSCSNVKNISA